MDEANGYGGWWFDWLRSGVVDPKDYDGVEVHPCCVGEDGHGTQWVEPCEPHEADLWSTYVHCKAGGTECVGDFATEQDAQLYALLISIGHMWRHAWK